ncbi:hypothetical protein C8J57DRAFT_1590109 [Mycena rebaudengoi]|nr:hypothetical protein C8J57DRAFT_1590109 [Mycena rebaudengoi]
MSFFFVYIRAVIYWLRGFFRGPSKDLEAGMSVADGVGDVESRTRSSNDTTPPVVSCFALDIAGVPALTLTSMEASAAAVGVAHKDIKPLVARLHRYKRASVASESSSVIPSIVVHTPKDVLATTIDIAVEERVDMQAGKNPTVKTSSPPKCIALGDITNHAPKNVSTANPQRKRTHASKRVKHGVDVVSDLPGVIKSAPPDSLSWNAQKEALLTETRARNARIKYAAARRFSLPVCATAPAASSVPRRASAPATLGGSRFSLEERLRRAVSSAVGKPLQPMLRGDAEAQFVIGDDDDEEEASGSMESISSVLDALEDVAVSPTWRNLQTLPWIAPAPVADDESVHWSDVVSLEDY